MFTISFDRIFPFLYDPFLLYYDMQSTFLQETYGEDPYLSGVIAASFVKGLKGDHPRYYRANAVCKHFDAYGGPEDLPQSRLSFNAQVKQISVKNIYKMGVWW